MPICSAEELGLSGKTSICHSGYDKLYSISLDNEKTLYPESYHKLDMDRRNALPPFWMESVMKWSSWLVWLVCH
jgi:hypothetical protein